MLRWRAFRKAWVSYASIVLLTALLLGFLLLNATVNNVQESYQRSIMDKLELVTSDLSAQRQIMYDMALDISVSKYYQPFFRAQGAYYDIQILQDFSKYAGRSPIAEQIFLLFANDEMVFTPQGTNRFETFVHAVLKTEDADALYGKLNVIALPSILPYQDGLIFAWPAMVAGASHMEQNACVGFVCPLRVLEQRVQAVSGGLDGAFVLLADEYSFSFGEEATSEEAYRIRTDDGMLTLSFSPVQSESSVEIAFSHVNMIAVSGVTILMLLLAIVLAWKNLRPMNRLMRKYAIPTEVDKRMDEINQIDQMLDAMFREKRVTQAHLDEQLLRIREQQLLLLLSGEMPSNTDASFSGPKFCPFLVPVDGNAGDSHSLCRAIEALSDGHITFYAAQLSQESGLAVLAGYENTYTDRDAKELLSDLLDASGSKNGFRTGYECVDLENVGASFRSAVRSVEDERLENGGKLLLDVLKYIEEHAFEYDLNRDGVARHFSMAESTLYRLLKEGTGKTWMEYLTDLRVDGARRFLSEEKLSVAETAQRVGYANISYFIKTFKRVTGFTPGDYKKLMER